MIKRFVDIDGARLRTFNRHVLGYTEPKRASRRRQLIRMKAKVKRVNKRWLWKGLSEAEVNNYAAQLANNRKACSCWVCGNQRKWHGLTIQEIRQNAKEKTAWNS